MANDQSSVLRASLWSAEETSYSMSRGNPWEHDESSLGALRRVLFMGRQHGYVSSAELDPTDQQDVLIDAEEKYLSIKMINIMKEIDKTTKQLNQTNLEIQKRLLDKETKDITHQDVLERRVEMLNSLNGHLQSIVNQKDRLIGRLQQPYVGDFLKIQANYKEYASEVFPQLVPILSNLKAELTNIEWAGKVDIMDGQLESIISEVSCSLATLQSRFQALCERRESVAQLYAQYTDPEETSLSHEFNKS